MILPIIISLIFFILGIIHFNWVIGGTFGFDASLPTNEKGERVLNPKKFDSLIVGIALSSFAIIYLIVAGVLNFNLPIWIIKYGTWIIPFIFILRAIGDFKYIGFFKKVKQTNFGVLDSKYYSPLCLIIGVMGLIIKFY